MELRQKRGPRTNQVNLRLLDRERAILIEIARQDYPAWSKPNVQDTLRSLIYRRAEELGIAVPEA